MAKKKTKLTDLEMPEPRDEGAEAEEEFDIDLSELEDEEGMDEENEGGMDLTEYSDEELMDELKARGYAVEEGEEEDADVEDEEEPLV